MFQPGDKVVHARHGAGVVKESRTITLDGESREYFVIQMNDDRHTLMIPYDSIDEEELRSAMTDTSTIEEIMFNEPEELPDNYRTRQAEIRKKLKSRDLKQLSQALRDMSYLERVHKLTNTDTRLRDRLVKALARELALKPNMTISKARAEIQQIVERAMKRHLKDEGEDEKSASA